MASVFMNTAVFRHYRCRAFRMAYRQNITFAGDKTKVMQKAIFTLLFFVSTAAVFAADIKVDKTGQIAGSVPTISQAITTAANGDRIVVFSNGLTYTENLTIDKSLTFLSAAEGEYFYVTGHIKYVGANSREITVIGMHQLGNDSASGTVAVGSRCIVNIVDCEINGYVIFNQDGYDVNVLYNTIQYATELRYGKVIANKIGVEAGDNTFNGELRVTAESAAYGQGDTLFIIANRMFKADNTGVTYQLNFDNSNLRYFIANNTIRNGILNSTGYTSSRTCINIVNCYLTDSANVCINNFLSGIETTSGCSLASTYALTQLKGIKAENFVNNIFKNRYQANYGCGALGMRGDYNLYDYYRGVPLTGIVDNNYFNTGQNVTYTYDPITGKALTGNAVIDAGKPGVNYMDIDLTRSDLSTYGGPYTQANYWDTANPQGGRGRVFLLNMPANIYSLTTPVSIKANATHTK